MSSDKIICYFDFASPYAWIALGEAEKVAKQAGRELELRPVLLWAVLKELQIAPPLENPAKRSYLLADMARSAAFMGVPLRIPEPMTISAHLASRFWIGAARSDPTAALPLAKRIFSARFVDGQDIREPETLRAVAGSSGLSVDAVEGYIAADENRSALANFISMAVQDGVCGAPFFLVEGEGFFGADRLPQMRWRLKILTKAETAGATILHSG